MRLSRRIFIVWVFFWLIFLARGMYKGEFKEYKALFGKTPDERRAYVYGEEFFEFLKAASSKIERESTYSIAGNLKPIDKFRLIYYLYPRVQSEGSDYLVSYEEGRFRLKGIRGR